jgi:fatty-acyl-CoA synthase
MPRPHRLWRTVSNGLRAIDILQRRGMIDLMRPDQAVRGFLAMRRHGAFGGLSEHVAARYGDAPAITDDAGTLSFTEFATGAEALARRLRHNGIHDGSVVAAVHRNHRAIMLAAAATGRLGARLILLNTGFAGPQLVEVCERERVGAVLADPEFSDLLAGLEPGITRIVLSPADLGPGDGQPGAPLPRPRRPGGLVLLTSGTTGIPKGAPRERINPLQSAQLLDRIPWSKRSTYVVAAPLFHATGLAICALGLSLGNRVVLTRKFLPENALAAVAESRARVLVLVPTMLQRIVDLPPETLRRYDTSSLEIVFVAGSALSPELCVRGAQVFGEVLYNLYGSTEVAVAAVAQPHELRLAPGTVGRPPFGCRVVLHDEHRRAITEPHRTGTLFVASGLSFTRYTDGTTKEVVDGLLSTGDTGHFDERGLWFIDGRADDMIVSGGENVFPQEIEHLLAEHPDVTEASVIGVPDPEFGQRLRAYVVARPGALRDADDVRQFVRARLARHKVPRDVIFVAELPRNETGKVLRRALSNAPAPPAVP